MGTAPANFPPINVLPIGRPIVGNLLGLTASLPATVFFTAPTTGIYQIAFVLRIIASDGLGTLTRTTLYPHSAPLLGATAAPAVNADQISSPRTSWMNAGDTAGASVSAAGLGSTTYNVYLTVVRIF